MSTAAAGDAGRTGPTAGSKIAAIGWPATSLTLAFASLVGVVVAVVATRPPSGTTLAVAAATVAWAAIGVLATRARPDEPTGALLDLVALSAAVVLVGSTNADLSDRGLWPLLAAALLHLALALPTGHLGSRPRRAAVAVVDVAAVATVLAAAVEPADRAGALPAVAALGLLVVGTTALVARYRTSGAADRARLRWTAAGGLMTLAVTLLGAVAVELVQWPVPPIAVAGPASVALAIGVLCAQSEALGSRSPVVITDAISRLVHGGRVSDDPLASFAARMTRAVPLDELMLQLVDALRRSLDLESAELWTGRAGILELTASVPDRVTMRVELTAEELAVVSRSHASGAAWARMWLAELVRQRAGGPLRVVPLTHHGELLGLIVVQRAVDGVEFTENEAEVLTDLARQVALALHNVRLDSALQESLDELRRRNEELRASRARIVAAADESRRRIERDLHDGAQQHLVAMAVKIGLARQLLEDQPEAVEPLLEDFRADVQATLDELRELAHGIYPPLLRDRGLAEALRTAARRAARPTTVRADGLGRYSPEVESAVYFCCLEAFSNAAKYAGEAAELVVEVTERDTGIVFAVRDDGVGFDPDTVQRGDGFTNMSDRLGAVSGEIQVVSAPGAGSSVGGLIPRAALSPPG